MTKGNGSAGLGLCEVLTVVFVVLKLCGLIDWSWWWVTAPAWGGISVLFLIDVVSSAAKAVGSND